MSGVDELFASFRDPTGARAVQQRAQQLGFEERIIKQLLRYAGVAINVGQAVKQSREGYQVDGLCFEWFHEHYPQFPVAMGSAKLPFTSGERIGWTELFGRGFMRLPWMKEYMKLVAQMDYNVHATRVALVFNVPRADKATTMVLHNQPIQANSVEDPERRTETETRILRPFGNPRVTYVLESFNSFMDTVGTGWATEL